MTGLIDGASTTPRGTDRAVAARDHLWLHFTRHSSYDAGAVYTTNTRELGHELAKGLRQRAGAAVVRPLQQVFSWYNAASPVG